MSEEATLQTETKYPPVALEVAKYDPSSVQGQMIWGLLLVLVVCVCTIWPSGHIFSGDFFRVSSIALRDLPAPMQPIPSQLYDLMMLTERTLFTNNIWDYQLVSFLLSFLGCAASAVLVLEITGRSANKLGACPAIWASLLLAALPLSRGLSDYMGGQQWLLTNALMVISIACFFRYRLLCENRYYWISLAAFVLCLRTSLFPPFTFPLILSLSGIVTSNVAGGGSTGRKNFDSPANLLLPFWIISLVFWMIRPTGWTTDSYSWSDIAKVFSSDFDNPYVCLRAVVPESLFILLLAFLRHTSWRPMVFLVFWALCGIFCPPSSGIKVNMLQTSYPAICMLLALAALPSDAGTNRSQALILTTAGTLALAAIFYSWCSMPPNPELHGHGLPHPAAQFY